MRTDAHTHEIPDRADRRLGFSILELIVSVGVVAIILSLILPAVQQSREAGRRITCENNLRQIGVAVQSFESTHGQLPMANGPETRSTNGTVRYSNYSVQAQLLSYLDQSAIADSINFSRSHGLQPLARLDAVIPVLNCPSENETGVSYRYCVGASPFSGGIEKRRSLLGLFSVHLRIGTSAITDGSSQTAAFSERIIADENQVRFHPRQDYWNTGLRDLRGYPDYLSTSAEEMRRSCMGLTSTSPSFFARSGQRWHAAGFDDTAYNHVASPNPNWPDCSIQTPGTQESPHVGNSEAGQHSASSFHNGGVNVLFADGHVRVIADQVDQPTWSGFATAFGADVTSQGW